MGGNNEHFLSTFRIKVPSVKSKTNLNMTSILTKPVLVTGISVFQFTGAIDALHQFLRNLWML